MTPDDELTPEGLAAMVEPMLEEGSVDEALALVEGVEDRFPESALAFHLGGLVRERAYLEKNARGENPDPALYAEAARLYRQAAQLEPGELLHVQRLYTAVFVVGTQQGDAEVIEEAAGLVVRLAEESPESERAGWRRELAIVATARARLVDSQAEWERAAEMFDAVEDPPPGREAFFFHYYRGLAKHRAARGGENQEAVRQALPSLALAWTEKPIPAMAYLLADALVMLDDPEERQTQLAERLISKLVEGASDDPLVRGLKKRHDLRRQMPDTSSPE